MWYILFSFYFPSYWSEKWFWKSVSRSCRRLCWHNHHNFRWRFHGSSPGQAWPSEGNGLKFFIGSFFLVWKKADFQILIYEIHHNSEEDRVWYQYYDWQIIFLMEFQLTFYKTEFWGGIPLYHTVKQHKNPHLDFLIYYIISLCIWN